MAKEKKIQTSANKKKATQEKKKQVKTEIVKEVEKKATVKTNSKQDGKTSTVNKKTKETVDKNKKTKTSNKKDNSIKQEKLNVNMEAQVEVTDNGKEKQFTKNETNSKQKIENNVNKNSKKLDTTKKRKQENFIDVNARMNSSKVKNSSIVSSDEMGKLIKIILALIVISAVFYGITIVITKFQKTSTSKRTQDTTPAVIQYDEILIGTMLDQSRDEYYVLIQKDDDQYQTLTSYYLRNYSSKQNALKVYRVNMNSVFNQFHVAENSNLRTSNIGEFRVSQITLIKVKNHQIEEAYESIDDVENVLKSLIK